MLSARRRQPDTKLEPYFEKLFVLLAQADLPALKAQKTAVDAKAAAHAELEATKYAAAVAKAEATGKKPPQRPKGMGRPGAKPKKKKKEKAKPFPKLFMTWMPSRVGWLSRDWKQADEVMGAVRKKAEVTLVNKWRHRRDPSKPKPVKAPDRPVGFGAAPALD